MTEPDVAIDINRHHHSAEAQLCALATGTCAHTANDDAVHTNQSAHDDSFKDDQRSVLAQSPRGTCQNLRAHKSLKGHHDIMRMTIPRHLIT